MAVRAVYVTFFIAVCAVVVMIWLVRGDDAKLITNYDPGSKRDIDAPKPSPTGPHPKVVVDTTVHDFGTMQFNEKGSHIFTVSNQGRGPLILRSGESTCKCTIGKLAKKTLQPSESTEVELSWDTRTAIASFEHRARVLTNDPNQSDIRFTIKGIVLRTLIATPGEVWKVVNNSEGKPTKATGTIHSEVLKEFQVLNINTSNPLLTVTWRKLIERELALLAQTAKFEVNPQEVTKIEQLEEASDKEIKFGYKITLMADPEISADKFRESVTIHTDIESVKPLTVYVEGRRVVQTPFQFFASPGVKWYSKHMLLKLGRFTASKGKKATLSMFVKGDTGELQFSETASEPSFLKCSCERDPTFTGTKRQRYRLTVEIPPGSPPVARTATNRAKVSLKTNHPDAKFLELNVEFVSF